MKSKPKNALVDAEKQAQWFGRVRAAHQTEMAEDYVELIADLIAAQGEARIVDLSRRFGVSHATVNKIIARLNREGLVMSRPYRALFLTDKGMALARACKQRHILIVDFLRKLGVSAATAEADAEGIEHHVSAETLKAFRRFIRP
ncbi:MAG: manganese-binding transcriptional regulator MntR [Alphaproteobacteria bacterium]|nr:manganese-binding transcriptional regulator MntR [Alphaproteobacteria bacterium]